MIKTWFYKLTRIFRRKRLINVTKLLKAMIAIVIGIALIDCSPKNPDIWVTSPNGVNYKLPLWQARRVVRKRYGWIFTEVVPKTKELTRWQHFKMAIKI